MQAEFVHDLFNLNRFSIYIIIWAITRLNHFPSNGVATDPMTVFFYIFNAFKYWCSLCLLKYIVLKLK